MSELKFHQLSSSHKQDFLVLMAAAFKKDPLFLALFGQASSVVVQRHFIQLLGYLYEANQCLGGQRWGAFLNDRLVGCALVDPAIASKWASFWKSAVAAMRFIPLLFRIPLRASSLLNGYLTTTRALAPDVPHYYITMIGVAESAQGLGIGEQLMNRLFAIADQDLTAQGIALDTENFRNVGLYEKWGFTLQETSQLGSVEIFSMFRPKQRL